MSPIPRRRLTRASHWTAAPARPPARLPQNHSHACPNRHTWTSAGCLDLPACYVCMFYNRRQGLLSHLIGQLGAFFASLLALPGLQPELHRKENASLAGLPPCTYLVVSLGINHEPTTVSPASRVLYVALQSRGVVFPGARR